MGQKVVCCVAGWSLSHHLAVTWMKREHHNREITEGIVKFYQQQEEKEPFYWEFFLPVSSSMCIIWLIYPAHSIHNEIRSPFREDNSVYLLLMSCKLYSTMQSHEYNTRKYFKVSVIHNLYLIKYTRTRWKEVKRLIQIWILYIVKLNSQMTITNSNDYRSGNDLFIPARLRESSYTITDYTSN